MNGDASFEAVVLAGGLGTRLAPYTSILPKPLMPVGGRPILRIIIEQLRQAGVQKVTLAVNHMADLIAAVIGDGSRLGVNIAYSQEQRALGTIAPLKLIESLPASFLVMNGDVLTDLDVIAFRQAHIRSGSRFTIAACHRAEQIDFGVLEIDETGTRLLGHREKPRYEYKVSMGVYMMDRSLLDEIPGETRYGVDTLALAMLARGEVVNTYVHSGRWFDLGRPEDFERANRSLGELGVPELREFDG